jgi:hypothetical protein
MSNYLTTKQVSLRTTFSESTLRKWRMRRDGGGLKFYKIGRRCVYAEADVDAFIVARVAVK